MKKIKNSPLINKDNELDLKNNSISTEKLIDNSITTEKVLNDAITTEKIIDNAITSDKLSKELLINKLTIKNSLEIKKKDLIKNLNTEYLNSKKNSINHDPNTIVERDENSNIISNQYISTTEEEPFKIRSSIKVNNLNVDKLHGLKPSNNSFDIPISNGQLNNNLNAELLNGLKISTNELLSREEVIPTERIITETLEKALNVLDDKYEELCKQLLNYLIPKTISLKSDNEVVETGHTHEFKDEIIDNKSEQIISGKKEFKNISSKQELTNKYQLVNKNYVDNKFIRHKNILGLNIEYQNQYDIIINAGECFDTTYNQIISLKNKVKKSLRYNRFNNVALKPFTTYHIFIIKDKNDNISIGFDNSINASNRPKEYIYYRRIGSILYGNNEIVKFTYYNELKHHLIAEQEIISLKEGLINLPIPKDIKTIPLIITNSITNEISNEKSQLFFEKENNNIINIKLYGWIDFTL